MIFNKALAQVMTPPRVVKDMLNLLDKDCFEDLSTIFLEPSCGTGNFLIEIIKRKIRANKKSVASANDAYMLILQALDGIKAIDLDNRMVKYSQYRIAKFVQRWLRLWKPEFQSNCINHFKILDALLGQTIVNNIIQGNFLEMSKEQQL
jgi:hypothetical protein